MSLPAVDIPHLPLVIAGPIVRRVEASSTTVWVALKSEQTVTLDVWSGESATGAPVDRIQQGTRVTARIGEHLYVVAVTAQGRALAPGTLYRYTLRFAPPSASSVPVGEGSGLGLFDPGVIAATPEEARAVLLYGDLGKAPQQPSFITPPASTSELRLVHGSCRKPHGPGLDGLSILDQILTTDIASTGRPHQLLLTGDQIYADDVADVLLQLCMTRGAALLGREEKLPGVSSGVAWLHPGQRQSAMKSEFGLSSSEAKSHLITFAEFACMYLMVWSDVLWPKDLAAGFVDLHGFTIEWFEADIRNAPSNSPKATSERLILDTFRGEQYWLEAFRKGLPAVRRALANTATYMMFDDHEITDDWYITEDWVRRVTIGVGAPINGVPDIRNGALGRRVITNGLAAFALFQAWGNAPDRFAETDPSGAAGRDILAALGSDDPTDPVQDATLQKRLGIPTGILNSTVQRRDGAIDWHFNISWPSHQLIVLDTRTRRRYLGGALAPPALLLADADYDAMLPPASGGDIPMIVVSPAPVIGNFFVELGQAAYAKATYSLLLKKDGEAWGFQKRAFEKLIARLITAAAPGPDGVRRNRVVLLSGDVHYGFSVVLRYTAEKPYHSPPGPAIGTIAQLVSSALKNFSDETRKLHNNGLLIGGGPYLSAGRQDLLDRDPGSITGEPVIDDSAAKAVAVPPEWNYSVSFLTHREGSVPARNGSLLPVDDPTVDRILGLAQYVSGARNHRACLKWITGKIITGLNNIGEIRFDWPASDDKRVTHTIWWRMGDESTAAPLTRHVVPMKLA
jgi:hypothetical protein